MSWYRTYRPQKISELHLASVRDALERVRKSGVFSHAYLFAGPKGTGKTSSARILSKMLNCKENAKHKTKEPFHEPCNECVMCKSIMQGSSVSVLEMDAASNRGIDDIRALRDSLYLAPTEGKYTVYIIDEVHMLTTEAFNALLKVLEEPPSHVVFILATTELHKLPDTIVSRCTLVPFQKATKEEIVAALTIIAEKENIVVAKEHLVLIAQQASGSFRDAVKLFEQIASGKTNITEEDITSGVGSNIFSKVLDCQKYLYERDSVGIVRIFSELEAMNADVSNFQKHLLNALHDDLIHSIHDKQKTNMLLLIISAVDIPLVASLPFPQLPLEVACLKLCQTSEVKQQKQSPIIEQKVKQQEHMEHAKDVHSVPISEVKHLPKIHKVEQESIVQNKESSISLVLEDLESIWIKLLESLRKTNASLEALLKAAQPKGIEGNTVTLEVFYPFHKDQLSQEKYRRLVESSIATLCGTSTIKVQYVLGDKSSQKKAKKDTSSTQSSDGDLASVAEEVFL